MVDRIGENCEPSLTTVLFLGGAGGSLRAGATENPVLLTRAIKNALVNVTCGGAPAYVWPGGGITVMVDVMRMPDAASAPCPRRPSWRPSSSACAARLPALGGHLEQCARWRTCWRGRLAQRRRAAGAALARQAEANPGRWAIRPAGLRPAHGCRPPAKLLTAHAGISSTARWIVIGAEGEPAAVAAAHERAWQRFRGLLAELVAELPACARRWQACALRGPVARRMWQAVRPFRAGFITPMAAVAGAVAQELLAAYQARASRAPGSTMAATSRCTCARRAFPRRPVADLARLAWPSRARAWRSMACRRGRQARARRGHQRLARAQPRWALPTA
jgi:hypothetical protein